MNHISGQYDPYSFSSCLPGNSQNAYNYPYTNSQNNSFNFQYYNSMSNLPINSYAPFIKNESINEIYGNTIKENTNYAYQQFESSNNNQVIQSKLDQKQKKVETFPTREITLKEKDIQDLPRPSLECSPVVEHHTFQNAQNKSSLKKKDMPQTHRNYIPFEINDFELKEIKNKSYFSETKEAIYKPNRSKVFITCINKVDNYDYQKLRRHFFNILPVVLKIKNENTVKIHSIFEDLSSFYICSDVPLGVNLLYSLDNTHLSENDLRNFVKAMIEIIQNKLTKSEPHPKISLENIYYSKNVFRLYDFGKFLLNDQFADFSHCLSELIYHSPIYLKTKIQTEYSELWRIGIVIMILVFGKIPFSFSSNEDLKKQISNFNNNIVLEDGCPKNYSQSFFDFLKSIFNNNENFTLELARNHPWIITSDKTLSTLNPENPIQNSVALTTCKKVLKSTIIFQTFLINYIKYNNLVKSVIDLLRTSFSNHDLKLNESIEKNLCQKIITSIIPSFSLSPIEVSKLFTTIPCDDEGFVDYTQLFSKIINISLKYFEDRFERLFLCLQNDRGQILKEKLLLIFQVNDEFNVPYFQNLINEFSEETYIKYIDFLNIIYTNYRVKATRIKI